jgi:flagellar hook-associated protein 3 FlgL
MRVDPSYVSNLVGSLDQAQFSEQQLTAELSSGVSITSLSDNPVAAGENVQLLNQIQQDDSFTQSSSLVTGQLQVSDSTLGSVVSQLTQAISLATSANNGTLNPSNVRAIGQQISGILDEVQSLANTSYQGQYIFGGAQTGSVPFTTQTGVTPAVTTYNGDQNVNYLQTLNVPGSQIFLGTGANSVFGALNSLVADYSTGTVNTPQAISDTLALGTAMNFVSQQRVVVDNSITQVTAATEAVTSDQTQLTATQTNLMQADVGQVSTQLSLTETQQTALEDVIAQLNSQSNSLFSKLQ